MTRIEIEHMEAVKRIARLMERPAAADWEQRRYETARECMAIRAQRCADPSELAGAAAFAVAAADALVAELLKRRGDATPGSREG